MYDEPFGNSAMGDRLSPGTLGFLITSNAGPSLLLTGGVDAFSYSVIRLRAGGDGVLRGLSLRLA